MNRTTLAECLVCAAIAAGCSASAEIKPYGTPGSSVRPIGSENHIYFNGQFEAQKNSGLYIFDYDRDALEGHNALDINFMVQYLGSRELLPPKCANGIEITRHGDGENGKSWLIFKCL